MRKPETSWAGAGLLLMGVLVAVAAGCRTMPAAPQTVTKYPLEDGAYKGIGMAGQRQAIVNVQVEEGRVKAIEVLRLDVTPYTAKAVPEMTDRILEAQTVEVDAVTGATTSSGLLLEAVENALEQARKKSAAAE
jgi:uncharacterized protein with FMN-binding domain